MLIGSEETLLPKETLSEEWEPSFVDLDTYIEEPNTLEEELISLN